MSASGILRKGWCPSAHRPMKTGDGWLVRLHTGGGDLMAAQARAIAVLSAEYGNGHLDLTSRGNLQIRGVALERYETLFKKLAVLGLAEEQRPPRVAPSSPPPLGFANGTIGLGLPYGRIEAPMLAWLADMAEQFSNGTIALSRRRAVFLSGISSAENILRQAAARGFIIRSDDPRRAIECCPGAPACSSAKGETRALAEVVAGHFPDLAASGHVVHISGCTKGCAYSRNADVIIVAVAGAYHLACDARADAPPTGIVSGQSAIIEALRERL
ncbi:MAG: hypothetical protein KGJ06_03175 [Pseudomonadota bacterium]|nr:hypothetical protein [Pseudomonadota bacterium]